MARIYSHEECPGADLTVDAVYEGGQTKDAGSDAISKVLHGSGNQGGFRAAGTGEDKKFVALYTSGKNRDWPGHLELSTGQFVYFGDNKTPGHELHETPRSGNRILRRVFDLLHANPSQRALIPPFFVFKKYPTSASARSVQFKGLAAPGFPGLAATSDLVAVWKTTGGQRFQNYRAVFTVLDVPVVPHAWLHTDRERFQHTGAFERAPATRISRGQTWRKQRRLTAL
ncbi:hypothetical protein [Bradyrhizobium sp. Ec3.3]|uniref:hypothetical protein n=1 Tax=Bradyrhizobium sp. Ec3.3 TaxID=189753 RepID=UPI0012EC3C7B|nr:hypothetical protein [Bradyrhizobium sp. Ec3.3]